MPKPVLVNVRQIHSLWEVLPEQAVGVFVGTALPGTLRIAEEVEPVLAATLSQIDTTMPSSHHCVVSSKSLV
jgi:hypothetical protein